MDGLWLSCRAVLGNATPRTTGNGGCSVAGSRHRVPGKVNLSRKPPFPPVQTSASTAFPRAGKFPQNTTPKHLSSPLCVCLCVWFPPNRGSQNLDILSAGFGRIDSRQDLVAPDTNLGLFPGQLRAISKNSEHTFRTRSIDLTFARDRSSR